MTTPKPNNIVQLAAPSQEVMASAAPPALKTAAEIFLLFHYGELKDLGKHFLVIASAVLAFTVTFPEKVSGDTGIVLAQRSLLVTSWFGMMGAFTAAGIGLYYNFRAAAQA